MEDLDTPKIGAGLAGPGRPKGLANKFTREVKEMILEALDGAGGVDYLIAKADTHPAAFLSLLGRVLPLQLTGKLEHEHSGSVSGEAGRLVEELRSLGRASPQPSPLSH